MRGTWFYFDESLSRYVPFNESLANSIDLWFEEEKNKAYLLDRQNPNPSETLSFRAEKDIAFERVKNSSGPQQYRFVITRDTSFDVEDRSENGDGGGRRSSSGNDRISSSSSSDMNGLSSKSPTLEKPPVEGVEVVSGTVRIKAQNSMDSLHVAAEREHEKPLGLQSEKDDYEKDQEETIYTELVGEDLLDMQPPLQRR